MTKEALSDCPYTRGNPISWYFMCSYSYYVNDESLTDDHSFDALCKWLYDNFDNLPEHPHKHLLSKDNLKAGTYLGEYPEMIKGAVSYHTWEVLKWHHKSKESTKKSKKEKKT